MAISVTIGGTAYSVPEPGDVGYGQSLTNYLVAIASGVVQLNNSGTQALAAEWNAGSSFGIKAPYFKTSTATPATTGLLRAARADSIAWRNQANSADLPLSVDTTNNLTFASAYLTGQPVVGAMTAAGQGIPTGATETIVVFGSVDVTDSDSAFNVGTGRFTVPANKAGVYMVMAQIAYNTAPGGTCTASIYKNAAVSKTTQFIAPAALQTITVMGLVSLAVADVIDIRTKHGNVGTQNLVSTAALNYVAIKRLTT